MSCVQFDTLSFGNQDLQSFTSRYQLKFRLTESLQSSSATCINCCYLILLTAASSLVSFCWLAVVEPSSGGSNAESFIRVWEYFLFLLEEWYCPTACITSEAVQWWWVRASCRVKGPSLVRLTPVHAAVLRSSSPISCTTLRKYFWVSFRHCTSVRREENY